MEAAGRDLISVCLGLPDRSAASGTDLVQCQTISSSSQEDRELFLTLQLNPQMYMLMRYNGVHILARKKIGNALVTAMIGEYMKATTTTSSQRLAAFIGLAPSIAMKIESSAKEENLDQEFQRRSKEVFTEIFPEHELCVDSCCGHQLPEMPAKFLKELGWPEDISALARSARKWFNRIDTDGFFILLLMFLFYSKFTARLIHLTNYRFWRP